MSHTVAADLVGVNQSTVSRVFRRFLPLIDQASCLHVPPFPGVLTGRVGIIDGTPLPTGDRAGHRDDHSDTGRRSGPNVQVMSDLDGQLLAISTPTKGSTHDRRAARRATVERCIAHVKHWKMVSPDIEGHIESSPRSFGSSQHSSSTDSSGRTYE
ncbi:transposase [Actinokineospora auranticolor]|uniref:transposase n=1 Tax=Actinokineospora auranticolor TaxID=155976 RepID=UPI0035A9561C